MYEVLVVDTPSLGDRSYLVHDGRVAFVVDPQRDIDRVLALADARGVRVADVFETHVHNDYVTGGLALARATGARYHLNAADPVRFGHQGVADGDRVAVSPSLVVRVVAAPGHTHTHLAYALEHGGTVVAVFSGGSLLFGSTGRPDLLGPEHTPTLAHAQWRTARRLAAVAPAEAELYPTHGFGSFCSASQAEVYASTIGSERLNNPALLADEDPWVADMLAELDDWPSYYAHMAPANLAGPTASDLRPPQAPVPGELHRRVAAGEWVVDLRPRAAYCAAHLRGTVNVGLEGSAATYLGWLLPWGSPVTLLGASPGEVAAAQRELTRIGIDRPAAASAGDPAGWSSPEPPAALRRATFAELAEQPAGGPAILLDVRRRGEWRAGHLDGAIHLALHELPGREGELPDGELWVHCQSGYRASIAASLLARAGRSTVLIDDDLSRATAAGRPWRHAHHQPA